MDSIWESSVEGAGGDIQPPVPAKVTPVGWQAWLFVGGLAAIFCGIAFVIAHYCAKKMRKKDVVVACIFWICLAAVFGAGIYAWHGSAGLENWVTTYTTEWATSVDNAIIFLILSLRMSIPDRQALKAVYVGSSVS